MHGAWLSHQSNIKSFESPNIQQHLVHKKLGELSDGWKDLIIAHLCAMSDSDKSISELSREAANSVERKPSKLTAHK